MIPYLKCCFFSLLLILLPGIAHSQIEALNQANKLYVLAWIPEFPDSFMVLLNVVSESEYQHYCVLNRLKKSQFDLDCWEGRGGLEDPARWGQKLYIRFNRHQEARIKFGRRQKAYRVQDLGAGRYWLVAK
ncbi:MAG TPA: hypothetical protein VK168_04775 [Saprospiraceae bacterium]|nr:hypothetical protein [Saprospiraceae bacterium]